ncbi:luciferase domain-containing protein [Nocardia aobensis]
MRVIRTNYLEWKDLGPGGLPANPVGWLVATALRPLARDPLHVCHTAAEVPGWHLPLRATPRPGVSPFPIPHRQLDSKADRHTCQTIAEILAAYARSPENDLYLSRSRLERRGEALYVSDGVDVPPWVAKAGREIAHVHISEGSLHVVANPSDARQIISAGWGELHPLAGRPMIGLPESYVFLYAPEDEEDLRQLSRIIARVVDSAVGS